MFWLKLIKNFLSVLRDGQTPAQIASGFALGAILGLSPMLTLQGALVWLLLLALDINLSAGLLALTIFSLFAYLLDPVFHRVGYTLLVDVPALQGAWIWMYNAPIAPLTRFNNTVVMGSFVIALVLTIPVYVGMRRFVVAYRTHIHSRIEKLKIYQIIHRSTLYQWYERIRDLKG
jgi:uncharacterized protein (TIGR03546 family)